MKLTGLEVRALRTNIQLCSYHATRQAAYGLILIIIKSHYSYSPLCFYFCFSQYDL